MRKKPLDTRPFYLITLFAREHIRRNRQSDLFRIEIFPRHLHLLLAATAEMKSKSMSLGMSLTIL